MFYRLQGLMLLSGLLLGACGGGGGSPSSMPPPPPPFAFAQAGPVYKFIGDAAYTNAATGGAGNGAITYASDTPAVATVDSANGQVTINATGSAHISASKAADGSNQASQAGYDLRVAPHSVAVTAWAGPADTTLDLAPLPLALDIAHSTDLACDPVHVTTCQNGVQSQTSSATLVDATTSQSQLSMYWLKHGPNVTTGIAVPEHVFSDTILVDSAAGNGKLWVMTSGPQGDDIWSSADGANWSLVASNVLGIQQLTAHLLFANNALWIIVDTGNSNPVWRSTDGRSWTALAQPNFPVRSGFAAVAFNGRLWILGGVAGNSYLNDLWSSTDGVTWIENNTAVFPSGRFRPSLAAYNGKLWAAAGDAGFGVYASDVWSSPDGAVWTQATASAAFSPRSGAILLSDGARLLLIGGIAFGPATYQEVWTSTDGASWSLAAAPANVPINFESSATYGNGAFWIFDGGTSEVWRSPTGVNWNRQTLSARIPDYGASSAAGFQAKLWVIGLSSQLFSSSDGINWTTVLAAMPGNVDRSRLISLPDRLIFVTGPTNSPNSTREVWQSTDGANWTRVAASVPFTAGDPLQLAWFAGKLWAFSVNATDGVTPEIWWTLDRINWTLATSSPAFSPLVLYQVSVYGGALYVIGGQKQGGLVNEVWSSTDGVAWTQLPTSASLPQQVFPASFALSDKMCVSGANGPGGYNSLWCSADGSNWSLATDKAPVGVHAQLNGLIYAVGTGLSPYTSPSLVWRSSNGIVWRLGYQNTFQFP